MINKLALGYENIVLRHNKGIVNSRSECDISILFGEKRLSSPVICSNMPYIQKNSILETFNKRKWGYIYHRMGGMDDILSFVRKINDEDWYFKCISVGIKGSDKEILIEINKQGYKLDCLVIDVAFIYNLKALEFVKFARQLFPKVYLVAGNFDSPTCAIELANIGVNCGKFGIGVSKKCATRPRTAFGTSIISDLIECVEKTGKTIDYLVDGGLETLDNGDIAIGDVFKALNFGGKACLSASLFQKVTELADGNGNILCYGNSTARAKKFDRHDEGFEFLVKTNGKTLEEQMNLIEDSLKSSCSYAGIRSIEDAAGSCDYRIVL